MIRLYLRLRARTKSGALILSLSNLGCISSLQSGGFLDVRLRVPSSRFSSTQAGCNFDVGVDEAGKGAVLGPLVYAAVAFTPDATKELKKQGVKDSKRLTPQSRQRYYNLITALASRWKTVHVSAPEVDKRRAEGENLNEIAFNSVTQVLRDLFPLTTTTTPPTILTSSDSAVPSFSSSPSSTTSFSASSSTSSSSASVEAVCGCQSERIGDWSEGEVLLLLQAVQKHGGSGVNEKWKRIACDQQFAGLRSEVACSHFWAKLRQGSLGPSFADEDIFKEMTEEWLNRAARILSEERCEPAQPEKKRLANQAIVAADLSSINVRTLIVDSWDVTPARLAERLRRALPNVGSVVCEHKADDRYVIVSAASILAKVERDNWLKEYEATHKLHLGSGYPVDAVTIAALKRGLSTDPAQVQELLRRSWNLKEPMKGAEREPYLY
eukprot:gb/GEZN01007716.1/.p1 GENE.gb/GEZN01007716.1/~~gb/GEZN01007716.1/.p1  ORF type:complete len:439 (-),score=60.68 gb/GEZN01007716.1/:161-1477(-)